ncbi:condensation domain-containing protein, partial [Kitasatospora sp. NPDC047058]|uniref:condensation domain-containing protein n=1 Tax=Kitasatospora sp. NPDC047058 TaxID=3155620 RepID=UPI00340E344A
MGGSVTPGLPLSRAQLGMWFADQDVAHGGRCQIAEYFDIAGPVDPAVFDAAWTRAWSETEALRVVLTDTPDGPRQSPRTAPAPRVHVLDLSAAADPAAAAGHWMRQDLARPLDVTRDAVCTVGLLRLSARRFLWYQRAHHVAIDGYGAALFARRVADLYTCESAGLPAPAPDFCPLHALLADDEAYRASPAFEADRRYWTQRLADRPAPASLGDGPWQPTAPVLRSTARIPADRADRLRAGLGRSLAPAVVAILAAQLHLATGAEDVVVSLPVTARRGELARRTPGMLSNVVPIRLEVRPGRSFAELTRQAAAVVKEALPHQRYRFEDLHRDLGFRRGAQGVLGPSVNVMTFPYAFDFGGYPAVAHNLSNGPVGDLAVAVTGRQRDRGLGVHLDGSAARYDADALARHQEDFLALVRAAAEDPSVVPAAVRPSVARRPAGTEPADPPRDTTPAAPAAPAGADPDRALDALVAVVRDVLGADAGPDDSFFELGGDSITAIQLVARAREKGWAVTLKHVFARETPRGLAEVAEPTEPTGGGDDASAGSDAPGAVAPTPALRRLEELGGAVDAYHQSLPVRTPAGLSPAGLDAVVTAVVRHHDLLRARLVDTGGWHLETTPADRVDPAGLVRRIELPEGADDPRAMVAEHLEPTAAGLDPRAGVMLQARWLDTPGERGLLLLAVHHLAVDGASWHVLLRDLALAWDAWREGRPIELPPVRTPFARWSTALAEAAHAPERVAELPHWRAVLAPED